MFTRPNKNTYYLDIALAVSRRATCLKKQYGAIIVNNDIIISTGFNGSPRNEPHCNTCTKIKSDKDVSEYTFCPCVHAEQNAIINASRIEMLNSTLYLACYDLRNNQEILSPKPCEICLRLIKNAGINQIITRQGVIYKRNANGILERV